MLPVGGALLQQRFDGRFLVDGGFVGIRLGVFSLRPRTQEHGDLKTFIGIGGANRLRSGNSYSFTTFKRDMFSVISHRLLSLPGTGMERGELYRRGEGVVGGNLVRQEKA